MINTMKKIIFTTLCIWGSCELGVIIARKLFNSPLDPNGCDMIAPCIIMILIVLWAICRTIRQSCEQAAAVRMAAYIDRRDRRFEEIENYTRVLNYELMRADFLEGREQL